MNRLLYEIQIKSMKMAIEHLQTLDLEGLRECAAEHGTEAEIDLIDAVLGILQELPRGTGHP